MLEKTYYNTLTDSEYLNAYMRAEQKFVEFVTKKKSTRLSAVALKILHV